MYLIENTKCCFFCFVCLVAIKQLDRCLGRAPDAPDTNNSPVGYMLKSKSQQNTKFSHGWSIFLCAPQNTTVH